MKCVKGAIARVVHNVSGTSARRAACSIVAMPLANGRREVRP